MPRHNAATQSRSRSLNARQASASLEAFVDALLPGDSLFPAASRVGVHHALAERLRAHHGSDAVTQLIALLADGKQDFARLSPQQRAHVVRRLERDEPDRFAFVRAATYFAYYQHPLVVQAIRQLGHDYNDSPQPDGYAMPAFDPHINAPRRKRGFYKKSDEVARVNTESLANLLSDLPRYPASKNER